MILYNLWNLLTEEVVKGKKVEIYSEERLKGLMNGSSMSYLWELGCDC